MTSPLRRIHQQLKRLQMVLIRPATPYEQIAEALDAALTEVPKDCRNAIALIAQIDNYPRLERYCAPKDLTYIVNTLAHRLAGGTLSRDDVVHLGEGKFAISLNPVAPFHEDDVLIIAGQIQDAIAIPIIHSETQAKVTASIGCAMARTAAVTNGAALLEAACTALAEASQKGPAALRMYEPEMGKRIRLRQTLSSDARMALTNGALHAHFQPQIHLATDAISGCEALARWNHAEFGMVSPADFLPVLEEEDLMRDLGRVMLRDALRTLKSWDDADLRIPAISVNMCAEELSNPDLVEEIKAELARQNLGPERLVIEVLETVGVIDGDDPVARNLSAISKLGCQIDLDDYGTGQTSIRSVRNFSVDRIKIDRSYVTGIDCDPEQQYVVETILKIARNLQVDTLAEGVETTEEIAHLMKSGCDYAQGYAIARALPAPEAMSWIKSHRPNPPRTNLEQYAP